MLSPLLVHRLVVLRRSMDIHPSVVSESERARKHVNLLRSKPLAFLSYSSSTFRHFGSPSFYSAWNLPLLRSLGLALSFSFSFSFRRKGMRGGSLFDLAKRLLVVHGHHVTHLSQGVSIHPASASCTARVCSSVVAAVGKGPEAAEEAEARRDADADDQQRGRGGGGQHLTEP